MATIRPYRNNVSQADAALAVMRIEDVAAGDRLDFREILGRPARRIQVTLTDAADEMTFLLNNRRSISRPAAERTDGKIFYRETQKQLVKQLTREDVYLGGPEFSFTGDFYESPTDLPIEIFEVSSLTLSTGTTVEVIAW